MSGLNEAEGLSLIDSFNSQNVIPPSSRPYISAVCANTLTISAPPGVLRQSLDTAILEKNKVIRVPIHGPFHASHLCEKRDVERILRSCDVNIIRNHKPRIPVLSSNTGKSLLPNTWKTSSKSLQKRF
ncbi:hypothetical protein BDW66DRAFT_41720 [Aspergillus desertorum]